MIEEMATAGKTRAEILAVFPEGVWRNRCGGVLASVYEMSEPDEKWYVLRKLQVNNLKEARTKWATITQASDTARN